MLTRIPPGYVVARQPRARLVLGRTGGFVLVPADTANHDALRAAASAAIEFASRTRQVLADHLPLAPFLDPLVICRRTDPGVGACDTPVVPLDLLPHVLADGPAVVTTTILHRFTTLLLAESLLSWRFVATPSGAMIDLCDPQPTTQPTS